MSLPAQMLPSITIPLSAPSSQATHYPTSPLMTLHRPQPPTHSRLRERCGFSLRITTSPPIPGTCGPRSPRVHVHPHRNNLPRRRPGQRKRIVFHEDLSPAAAAEAKPHVPSTAADPIPENPLPPADKCLQELVPGLSVAFALGDDAEARRALEDGYSHVVEICYSPAGPRECAGGSAEEIREEKAQRLRLVLPSSVRASDPGRAALALSDMQLRASRDFLAQALPYTLAERPDAGGVRILITTPIGRPTDAMSVMGCYLSFVSRKSVERVLRFIDEEEDFLSVWKGEVSGDEAERAETIARSWSWLSAIAVKHEDHGRSES